MSTSPIAACPRCNSINMMFVGELVDGVRSYSFQCGDCGHETPQRDELREADSDVWWITPTAPIALLLRGAA